MDIHPIQIQHIGISDIDFVGYRGGMHTDVLGEGQVEVNFSYAPYDSEDKTIMLMGEATIGAKVDLEVAMEKDIPFYLYLRIHGFFSVDESDFDPAHVNSFANGNAPSIMYPYLREHVHSLAIRCGYSNVILPLVKIPKRDSDK